jgi:hypothetical protein
VVETLPTVTSAATPHRGATRTGMPFGIHVSARAGGVRC